MLGRVPRRACDADRGRSGRDAARRRQRRARATTRHGGGVERWRRRARAAARRGTERRRRRALALTRRADDDARAQRRALGTTAIAGFYGRERRPHRATTVAGSDATRRDARRRRRRERPAAARRRCGRARNAVDHQERVISGRDAPSSVGEHGTRRATETRRSHRRARLAKRVATTTRHGSQLPAGDDKRHKLRAPTTTSAGDDGTRCVADCGLRRDAARKRARTTPGDEGAERRRRGSLKPTMRCATLSNADGVL